MWKRLDDYVFALGELEVISGGVNRARGAKVTALDSIEAGRWARANLVDGFDSRHACPALSDPVAERSPRPALPTPSGRARTAAAGRGTRSTPRCGPSATRRPLELAEIDQQLQSLHKGAMVYGIQSHAPPDHRACGAGKSSSPASRSVPGTLACLPGLPGTFSLAHPENEGSRRAALADWLASPANMLTWRSIANRLWHYHFGRGIVETPNDFGRNGARPTHPELLDWLAVELRDQGQSLKALHRLIVCERGLSPGIARQPGLRCDRRRQPLSLAAKSTPARRRGHPRQRPGGLRHARSPHGRARLRALFFQG